MPYYGHHWRNTRPPGLPASVRGVTADNDGRPFLRDLARAIRADGFPGLAAGLAKLAQNETSATRARPANSFDARPQQDRPAGAPLITAWGLWQYNRGHWQRLGRDGWTWQDVAGFPRGRILPDAANQMPWDATPAQEMVAPIELMIQAYMGARRAARQAGANEATQDRMGQAAIYYQHSEPGNVAAWMRAGAKERDLPAKIIEKLNRPEPEWSL